MPKFGDWITVKGRLNRFWNNVPGKCFVEKKWNRVPFPEPKEGIFLGKRTLANGIRYHEFDEGFSFEPKDFVTAYLVCVSPREKPFYAHPDDVETINLF